jgi:hypothetical protein
VILLLARRGASVFDHGDAATLFVPGVGPKTSYQYHPAPGESTRSMLSATATSTDDWLTAYAAALDGKAAGTVDAYLRALRQFLTWLA